MSAPKRQEYSAELSEEKSLFDVNDDLDHTVSLSYHPHTPLNQNPGQPATSIPLQHGATVGSPADVLDSPSAHEGLPPQAHLDSHPQNQPHHTGRNQSWDLLGGARKLGQGYERFDSRNPSEQYLAFADGDLPKSKASAGFCDTFGIGVNVARPYQFVRFYQYLIDASIVTRWTLYIVPILIILWIPGILALTASPTGKV